MSQPISYSISVEDKDIILRIDRDAIDMEALNRFFDYLKFESKVYSDKRDRRFCCGGRRNRVSLTSSMEREKDE